MSTHHTYVKPNTWLFLRLPTEQLRCIEIQPNQIIEVGKLGSFHSNLLLGRPYYYTYELLDKRENESYSRLRMVPPSELNADVVNEDATPSESRGEPATPSMSNILEDALAVLADKNNRLTVDDASRQTLSQQEIEELKKSAGGKEIIEKILANHSGLDEKTVFSKAKYMLRKTKKYLKRFTVLPMDLGSLTDYIFEKEPTRIMEMREETLGLITAWSNAHVTYESQIARDVAGRRIGGGRYLVVDETGGLVVAALAERMGILHRPAGKTKEVQFQPAGTTSGAASLPVEESEGGVLLPIEPVQTDHHPLPPKPASAEASFPMDQVNSSERPHRDHPPPAETNSITLLHPAVQPNISVLKYFGYDANDPDPDHPLHEHLKPLSWLQLLHPDEDPTYREPDPICESVLTTLKSGKRGAYWKKRRRWERCRLIVDEAREGGFEGLVIASNMDAVTILPHALPLVRGGGHIVIYSPTIEPLVRIMDLCSKDRRTAYIQYLAKGIVPDVEDFPLDPRLFLAPMLQTSRVRESQVLPGRTHPMMTSRGGAEGYVFTARKAIPLEGEIVARGNFSAKRRKVESEGDAAAVVNDDKPKEDMSTRASL